MAGADPFAPAPPPASCWLQVCSMQDQGQDPGRVRQHNLRMGDSLAPQSTQFCPAEQRASAGGEGERLAAELQVYLELTTIRDKLKVCTMYESPHLTIDRKPAVFLCVDARKNTNGLLDYYIILYTYYYTLCRHGSVPISIYGV